MRDDAHRRSFWMLRVLEWNDPKARYPNLWADGLPSAVLVFDTIARRVRIGDLIAAYHPASARHPERSERFVGLVRVGGLRRADRADRYWLDLDAVHRFRTPIDLGRTPRRVFLCCDPGWPETDRATFAAVHAAAVAEGWTPLDDEAYEARPATGAARAPAAGDAGDGTGSEVVFDAGGADEPPSAGALDSAPEPVAAATPSGGDARWFAGVSWSGDRRDPRDGSWLAVARLDGGRLRIERLEAVGRAGIQSCLRDPDRALMRVEATGCAFPFGQPEPFVEYVVGGGFPAEGWWGLARALESVGYAEFLVKVKEFRERAGDAARLADDRFGIASPLSRDHGDRASMSFYGIRTIAADRSRFAIRPFESAQGRLLLEVAPDTTVREIGVDRPTRDAGALLDALRATSDLPLDLDRAHRARCLANLEAARAVLAARCAARAVLSGETDRTPEELAPDAPDRVRREGWIYGVAS